MRRKKAQLNIVKNFAVLSGEVAVPCTRNPLQRGGIPARGAGVLN